MPPTGYRFTLAFCPFFAFYECVARASLSLFPIHSVAQSRDDSDMRHSDKTRGMLFYWFSYIQHSRADWMEKHAKLQIFGIHVECYHWHSCESTRESIVSVDVQRDRQRRRRRHWRVRMRPPIIIHSSSESALEIFSSVGSVRHSIASTMCVMPQWEISFDFRDFFAIITDYCALCSGFDDVIAILVITYQVHNKPKRLPLQCNAWPSENSFHVPPMTMLCVGT